MSPSEKGKPKWREQRDEWAGGWKKQRWLEPGEVSAPHRPRRSSRAQSIMLPVQAGIPALENEPRLGLQRPNLAGQRWMRLQQQGEVCSSGQRGAAWGRVRATAPSYTSPLCPPRAALQGPHHSPRGLRG